MKKSTCEGMDYVELFIPYEETDKAIWDRDGIQLKVSIPDLLELLDPVEDEKKETTTTKLTDNYVRRKTDAPIRRPEGWQSETELLISGAYI